MKSYEDIEVDLLNATEHPRSLISCAVNITQKQNIAASLSNISNTIKNLLVMNHTSLLEHVSYTFLFNNASRSFLAQATRHRIASPTSGSQHYQHYGTYDFVVHSSLVNHKKVQKHLQDTKNLYLELVEQGYPIYEARCILPNCSENNLMLTINARSLVNFFNLRLCNRNVPEMKILANKMFSLVTNHFPELFNHVGPDCYMTTCNQGKMQCPQKTWSLAL